MNSEGKCPKCGETKKFDYTNDSPDFDGTNLYVPVKCKKCGYTGQACYSIEFQEYFSDDEE